MKKYLLAIAMLFALNSYAQSVQKNDCSTCVGANGSAEIKEKKTTDIQEAAIVTTNSNRDELSIVNEDITNTILELRKSNIISLPEYVNTNNALLDKKNFLVELKKLLPEENK